MSKELDIDSLKKSWKEQTNSSHQYSQAELLQMLNKKTSNNVKYIVIISTIEFIILMLSLIFTSTDDIKLIGNLDSDARLIYLRNFKISQLLIVLNIIISFAFVFYFIKSYKKINILNSTSELINNILKFRKSVNWFIFINIALGLITLFLTGFYDFVLSVKRQFGLIPDDIIEFEKIHPPFISPEYTFWFIVICIIVIFIIVVYYSLIYGIFLRRLKKNLKELRRYKNID